MEQGKPAGVVIWLAGGAGKSTFALALVVRLQTFAYGETTLDGTYFVTGKIQTSDSAMPRAWETLGTSPTLQGFFVRKGLLS